MKQKLRYRELFRFIVTGTIITVIHYSIYLALSNFLSLNIAYTTDSLSVLSVTFYYRTTTHSKPNLRLKTQSDFAEVMSLTICCKYLVSIYSYFSVYPKRMPLCLFGLLFFRSIFYWYVWL